MNFKLFAASLGVLAVGIAALVFGFHTLGVLTVVAALLLAYVAEGN